MAIIFCKDCSAILYPHESLNNWNRCRTCGYCELKSMEQITKEAKIQENQTGHTHESRSLYKHN